MQSDDAVTDAAAVDNIATDNAAADEITAETEGLNITITSPGAVPDGAASIFINGTDFSLDTDGLNIAVYDIRLGEVFEMSAADLSQEMQIIRE